MRQLLRLFCIRLKQDGNLKNQIQPTATAEPALVVDTQPHEYRQTGPQKSTDAKLAGGLAAVGIGDDQIGAAGSSLQIHQINDQDIGAGQAVRAALTAAAGPVTAEAIARTFQRT